MAMINGAVKATINWISCPEFPLGAPDDTDAIAALKNHDIYIQPLIWQEAAKPITGLCVFRSPWDYYKHFNEFQAFLKLLPEQTLNPVSLIHWNSDKIYLQELESKGVRIFPTRFIDPSKTTSQIADLEISPLGDDLVIKPAVSAGSFDTFHIQSAEFSSYFARLKHHSRLLIQPYAAHIVEEGEFSVHYFKSPGEAPRYSHTIVKKPKKGDFRVQEKFGGSVEAITPDPELLNLCKSALSHLPTDWLYARVDCLTFKGQYCLAELEVFEPQLYFRFSKTAPDIFAECLKNWILFYESHH